MRRLTTEGRNAFAPMFPHEIRHKNNPMRRNAAWGSERVKHALEKRNRPAGTACRENVGRFGRLRLSGAAHVRFFPKRALRVAHGVTLVSPRRGAEKA